MRRTVVGTLAITAALAAMGCGERVLNRSYTFDETVDAIDGTLTTAAIAATADDGMVGARVAAEIRHDGAPPDHGAWVEDATLYLSLDCADAGGAVCGGSFNAVVPRDVSVNLTTTSGAVSIDGIAGVATVETTTGDVDLDDIGGSVDVRCGTGAVTVRGVQGSTTVIGDTGDVQVDDVRGRLRLESSTGLLVGTDLSGPEGDATSDVGQVWLTWIERPERVEITTTEGDVYLTVPAGPYQIIAGSVTGEVSIDGVQDDPTADAVLRIEVDYADVTILGV